MTTGCSSRLPKHPSTNLFCPSGQGSAAQQLLLYSGSSHATRSCIRYRHRHRQRWCEMRLGEPRTRVWPCCVSREPIVAWLRRFLPLRLALDCLLPLRGLSKKKARDELFPAGPEHRRARGKRQTAAAGHGLSPETGGQCTQCGLFRPLQNRRRKWKRKRG